MVTSIRWFTILSVALAGISAQASSTPVDNLLSFFGSTCASDQGGWTQAALGKATALRTVLEDLKNDKDCEALSAESMSANAISNSLTILNQQVVNNATDISLASQEQAVLSSMAYVTDPKGISDLQVLLAKIDAKSVSTQANDRLSVQANAANQLIASTHGLVTQALSNQTCMLKRPALLATIGSLVANVGAALTAVNPVLGLGTSAVGTLMSDLVGLGQQRKIVKGIKKLNDGIFTPEAVACVLESLTNDYCRAQDALTTMGWADKHKMRTNYPETSPLFGLGLLDRELNIFSRWLAKVKVSRLAQNPSDASRKQEFRLVEAAFLNSPDNFSGTIETFRTQLESVPESDLKRRWPIVRTMITSIVSSLGPPGQYEGRSLNPLFLTKNKNEAEFFLVGIDTTKLDRTSGKIPQFETDYDPLEPQKNPQPLKSQIADIQSQFDNWYSDTQKIVDDLRIQIQTSDILGTLESAFTPTQDYGRANPNPPTDQPSRTAISPYHSLVEVLDYLQNQLKANPKVSESFYYVPDTISRLMMIRDELDSLHVPNRTRSGKDYGNVLSAIYTASNLDQGSTFMENRIGDHVNSALVRYLSDPVNQTETAPILAQTLASERMTDILLKSNPLADRPKVIADIENSTTIILPAFSSFVSTYQKEIQKSLEYLQGQEIIWQKEGETFRKKRARICLMLTALPVWPDQIPYGLCLSTSFHIVEGGPESPVLTETYMKSPIETRSCDFANLQRDTLIHEARMDLGN
jgi:hypothetical protein